MYGAVVVLRASEPDSGHHKPDGRLFRVVRVRASLKPDRTLRSETEISVNGSVQDARGDEEVGEPRNISILQSDLHAGFAAFANDLRVDARVERFENLVSRL